MVHSTVIREIHNYPLESTVHISHIAQHAVAGERHAFLCREGRSQETEDRMREAELARRTSRRNSGNTRHFERSGAESRNPFKQKHRDREKKSHTDHTDFHRIYSPTTDYARKRADYTELDSDFWIPRLRLGMARSMWGNILARRNALTHSNAPTSRAAVSRPQNGLSFRTERSGERKPVVVPSFRAERSGVEKSSLK